ncbi:hypothetical protein P7K49_022587 [Saguinus oedipus]|uniref:Uncharacterized protein n=1 Tax=Saguinus oedipus TaxID=9490 RepID=A0ABQ9UJ81_SAGOE|nr:hypothetical protein P7K49_022587 [Saguinus oedipus]
MEAWQKNQGAPDTRSCQNDPDMEKSTAGFSPPFACLGRESPHPLVPAEIMRPALLVPQLVFFLCRTVDPAARAATALLGECPEDPMLVPLGVGPGMLEMRVSRS